MPTEMDQNLVDQRQAQLLTRREAIRRASLLFAGATLVGGSALLTSCGSRRSGDAALFSAEDIALLDTVAEVMLPATTTPGARAAEVGAFMALMVTDAYDQDEQRIFRNGMRQLNVASEAMHGTAFMKAAPAQQLTLLEGLDREQHAYMEARRETELQRRLAGAMQTSGAEAPVHYFRMMKELAMLGYFTSEIGYTQAMRYRETPGTFEPRVPLAPGDKSWAPHA